MTTAALSTSFPTLLDQIKRTDPDGAIAKVVEALTQRNPLLEDMVWVEGNLPTGHRFTSRTSLPSPTWRKFNQGVVPGKSGTDQVDEACGMMEARSVVDVDLAKLNGNEAAFRASEDMAFLQSLNNEHESGIFYHSTKTAPEKFMGLSPRLDSTSGPGGSQIIKADASPSGNDQTSIWLVCWGPDTVFGIYPKGSKAGIESIDMGLQNVDDGTATGASFLGYQTNWKWKTGLCVKDWRYLVRVCNIDVSQLVASGSTGANIIDSMVKASHQIFDRKMGRPVFYVNRTVGTFLDLHSTAKVGNSTLSWKDYNGVPTMMLRGIPIRETDGITITEAAVS